MSIIFLLIIHEFLHWIVAFVFKLEPILVWRILTPAIIYKNTYEDWKNLLVALSAPLILFAIGVFIQGNDISSVVVKFMCLANFINFLPFTDDGKVILVSIINILKSKN